MEKNPAYVAMTPDKNLPPQGDDGIAGELPYESPADMGSLRDIAASSLSDEHTLGSAYIWALSIWQGNLFQLLHSCLHLFVHPDYILSEAYTYNY